MAKKKKSDSAQKDLFNIQEQLSTAACVPAIREAVKAWRADGYKGITDTTRELLNFWFRTDHVLHNGQTFRYHTAQREAIETLIYIFEVKKIRNRKDLLESFAFTTKDLRLPPYDDFARYCVKMATGSGKTKVITHKVIYLISKNISPDNILCVTFTNKAANEMKERIEREVKRFENRLSSKPTVTTFHSLCAKILRIDGKEIGIANTFLIYDEQDQVDVIKDAIIKLDLSPKEYKPRSILATISQAKNELISESDYISFARGNFQQKVAQIYPLYQKILKENSALDFDDLLNKTVELFKKAPSVLEKYQNKFKYILIDEYQDTNRAQYILTKLLAEKINQTLDKLKPKYSEVLVLKFLDLD